VFLHLTRPRPGALVVCAVIWASALLLAGARDAYSLPASVLQVLEGSVIFKAGSRAGDGTSDIRIRLRNQAGLRLDSVRLRVAFASLPIEQVAPERWRYRTAYFASPLEPGAEGSIRLVERSTSLHSRMEIIGAVPALRVAINGTPIESPLQPFIWQGVSFGPLGSIAEGLGFEVIRHKRYGWVTLMNAEHAMVLQTGTNHAVLDGGFVGLKRGVRMSDEHAIGPLAEVFRRLGAGVQYQPEDNIVDITYPPGPESAQE